MALDVDSVDVRQFAEFLAKSHAVADNKIIAKFEAVEVRLHFGVHL